MRLRIQLAALAAVVVIATVTMAGALLAREAASEVEDDVMSQATQTATAGALEIAARIQAADIITEAVAAGVHAHGLEAFGAVVVQQGALTSGLDAVFAFAPEPAAARPLTAAWPPGIPAPGPSEVGMYSVVTQGDLTIVGLLTWRSLEHALQAHKASLPAGAALAVVGQGEPILDEGVSARAAVPGIGLDVVATQRPTLVQELRSQGMANGFGISLGFAAAAGFVAFAFSGAVTRPISAVQNAASSMAAGDLQHRVPEEGPQEMVALATQFNAMAEAVVDERGRLLELQAGLEERVKQRTEEVEAAHEATRQFYFGVGHEVKNPVLTMVNLINICNRDSALPTPVRRNLEAAADAGTRLQALMEDLLVFAKAQVTASHPVDVDVSRALRAATGRTFDGPAGTWRTDAARLDGILGRIVSVARHPTAVAWTIGDRLIIDIDDGGPPRTPEEAERLLTPFGVRAMPVDQVGLGLALAAGLAESLGGSLRLMPLPHGNRTRLVLP